MLKLNNLLRFFLKSVIDFSKLPCTLHYFFSFIVKPTHQVHNWHFIIKIKIICSTTNFLNTPVTFPPVTLVGNIFSQYKS